MISGCKVIDCLFTTMLYNPVVSCFNKAQDVLERKERLGLMVFHYVP